MARNLGKARQGMARQLGMATKRKSRHLVKAPSQGKAARQRHLGNGMQRKIGKANQRKAPRNLGKARQMQGMARHQDKARQLDKAPRQGT
jgi:hypothetical protein